MTAPRAVLKKFPAPGKAKSPGLAAVEISDLSSNGKKTVAKRFGEGRITGLALIALDVARIGERPETRITHPGLHHPGEGVVSHEQALSGREPGAALALPLAVGIGSISDR